MKYCPKCGMELPEDAKFCGKCSEKIPEEEPTPKLKYCPKCGREIKEGMRFCIGCGAELLVAQQPLPARKPTVEIAPTSQPIPYQQPMPSPPSFERPTPQDYPELAKKYDSYGIICGVLAFLLVIPLGVLGLYYGLRARNLDRTKIWGIATSAVGMFLGTFLSFAFTLIMFPSLWVIDLIELVITVALVLVVLLLVPRKYPKMW